MPEAGVQKDIFGYETPYFPKGKGEIIQVKLDDYAKMVEWNKSQGLPPPQATIKPKIEGIKGLEAETVVKKVTYEVPAIKSAAARKTELEALRKEVKALTEARKAPYWQARTEKALKMEQVRRPEIGEGYIMQPFAGGRIFKQEFIDSFNKFFGHDVGLPSLQVTSDIAGVLRITKAALDFSFMAIQGMPSFGLAHAYLLFNPAIGVKLMGAWYRTFGESIGAFFNPGVMARFMEKESAIAGQRISFGGSARAVYFWEEMARTAGRGRVARWSEMALNKIPLSPYERAEIAWFAGGEMVRDRFWRILSPKAIAKGQEFDLARTLDRITGITDSKSLGVPLTIRQLEQTFAWFAPNYTRACLTVLADIFRGGMTGAEARKAIGGMIAAGAGIYTGTQYAISTIQGKSHEDAWNAVNEGFCVYQDPVTGEWEWKPSARFMTLKIGNYNMGFGGFWYGLLRLAGNIMATVDEVGERERIDLIRIMKNGSINKRDNPFIYWWYCRASPLFGSGFELASGKDFLGYPIESPWEYARYIMTRFEPIWAEQGLNWMIPGMARDNEVPEGLAREALVPAELMGLRTFPESTWVSFYDKVNEYIKRIPKEELDEKQLEAWREGKLEWRHLTDMQKTNLLSRYPDLEELYGEAQSDSAVRNSPHWKAYEERTDEERRIYQERIDELTQQLLRGEIDTREYREKAGEAGQNYGSIIEAIQRDPNYAEIYDFFDKKEAEGDKYGFYDDIALDWFETHVFYAEDLIDSKGDYDWDERDRRIDEGIEIFGQDTYERILTMRSQRKELKGVNPVWIRKSADTEKLGRGYWRLPYKPIMEMDEEDEAEGNIPEEYKALWKHAQTLEGAALDAFVEAHPELSKDWRAEHRLENPEEDARLALWGYGGKLQTMEAYNLVVKWAEELGIPLEQLGMGLPPKSLIKNYFDHNKIVADTSGNSIESKLYLLTEGKTLLDWYIDQGIRTDDLSDENADELTLRVKLKGLEPESLEYIKTNYEIQAYQKEIPAHLIGTYVDWYTKKRTGYEDDWFLMENREFYRMMVDKGLWQERDFSKIPSRSESKILDAYYKLDLGNARLQARCEDKKLDDLLVRIGGLKPAYGTERCTRQEEAEVPKAKKAKEAREEGEEEEEEEEAKKARKLTWYEQLEEQGLLEEWLKKYGG